MNIFLHKLVSLNWNKLPQDIRIQYILEYKYIMWLVSWAFRFVVLYLFFTASW